MNNHLITILKKCLCNYSWPSLVSWHLTPIYNLVVKEPMFQTIKQRRNRHSYVVQLYVLNPSCFSLKMLSNTPSESLSLFKFISYILIPLIPEYLSRTDWNRKICSSDLSSNVFYSQYKSFFLIKLPSPLEFIALKYKTSTANKNYS